MKFLRIRKRIGASLYTTLFTSNVVFAELYEYLLLFIFLLPQYIFRYQVHIKNSYLKFIHYYLERSENQIKFSSSLMNFENSKKILCITVLQMS